MEIIWGLADDTGDQAAYIFLGLINKVKENELQSTATWCKPEFRLSSDSVVFILSES